MDSECAINTVDHTLTPSIVGQLVSQSVGQPVDSTETLEYGDAADQTTDQITNQTTDQITNQTQLSDMFSRLEVQPFIPLAATIPRSNLLRTVAYNGGSCSLPDMCVGLKQIPVTTEATFWCARGHNWTTIVGNVDEWCTICVLLKSMCKFDSKIQCHQTSYTMGQTSFEFVCSLGHRFIADVYTSRRGCRTCTSLNLARKKHKVTYALRVDCKCLNIHEQSRLRFHCNKHRHDPSCANPGCVAIRDGSVISDRDFDPLCRNFIACNQDFYATPKQLRYGTDVFSCKNNHRSVERREIVTTVRMFEILYDVRFDDDTRGHGIEFTGYNRDLGIAFTHGKDTVPNRCALAAEKWCNANNVKFVYVPASITRTSSIAMDMAKQLHVYGMLINPVQTTVTLLRTKMHNMDRANKLFEDRCVFH